MRIWIDLANSPHVPFFRPLANEFMRRGHEVVVTARQFAETVPLAEAAGFAPEVIGGHGGAKLAGKAGNLVGRGLELARWARGKKMDLAVSHNSYSQILAARARGPAPHWPQPWLLESGPLLSFVPLTNPQPVKISRAPVAATG